VIVTFLRSGFAVVALLQIFKDENQLEVSDKYSLPLCVAI
jgi:hypothetical protein